MQPWVPRWVLCKGIAKRKSEQNKLVGQPVGAGDCQPGNRAGSWRDKMTKPACLDTIRKALEKLAGHNASMGADDRSRLAP